jgi:hypothetical protein
MANFKLVEDSSDISWFDLPLGRTMKLLQWGGDPKGSKLDLALDRSIAGVDLKVLPDKVPAASSLFTLKGTAAGTSVGVAAYLPGSGQSNRYSEDLKVQVGGSPKKQPGYSVDLLSDLALLGHPRQVHSYSRIVKRDPSDNTHILSQNTQPGHYNCGDVAASYGPKLFSKETYTSYFVYYLSPTSNRMVDLRFDAGRLRHGISKIKLSLDKGTPVRVWLIHADGFGTPVIRPDWRTHYLTVIGYSATRFLYLDPWPHGSRLDYDGGMYSKTRNEFMGELEFDPTRLELGIGSPSGALGVHKYLVIGGP